MATTDPPRRGGARPNSGRTPLSPDEPSTPYTIRIPESWARALREHDLADAVRAAIARIIKRRQP